jgi:hypothetical protein
MSTAYNPAAWSTFFSAQVSASAALTGLIFVAVSINLSQIIGERVLVARAAKALFTLMGVLLACTLCLVPAQPSKLLGSELTFLGMTIWIATTIAQRTASHNNPYVSTTQRVLYGTLTQLSAASFVAAGISLLFVACGGLYWLVVGTVLSLVAAIIDAWVLLIEIQR